MSSTSMRTHQCGELRAEHIGQTVSLAGWVARRREHGEHLAFIDLRDHTGIVQCVVDGAADLRSEFVVRITGVVRPRPEGTVNDQLATGEVEVGDCRVEVLATAEPKATLFLGMCGGLHRSLEVGDFVLPTAAIRDEGASQHFMPPQVPALPTFKVQKFVSQIIVERGLDYRTGVIHTTDTRFWEFNEGFKQRLYDERALGIDMETATLFSVGFASKVPIGALLLVSDLPLKRGGIKTRDSAGSVFRRFTDLHIEIGIEAMSEIAERGEHIRHYRW